MTGNRIRTLIIDDSSLVRTVLKCALSKHPKIEVVGVAKDGVEGIRQIKALRPDVITLDVEMPRLNGIGVLERVAGKVPVSFVMVSTLTQSGATVTFEALRKGAFDYITKPTTGRFAGLPEFEKELQQKVIAASAAKGRRPLVSTSARSDSSSAPTLPPNRERGWIVAIGISCGGPQTLMQMMPTFPSDFVPILITQHMPAQFTPSFAKHLNDVSSLIVREAKDREVPEPGTVLIAPGSHHMRLVRQGMRLVIRLDDGPKVSGHRPSVDVMFESVAKACGPRAVGVIMTGMGADGATHLKTMQEAGAWTIGQDEETSLVYGMPMEAFRAGAVEEQVPLGKIPHTIAKCLTKGSKKTLVAR